jgi:hypothetical protein
MSIHKHYAGKYFQWENGLRFKVQDKCNEYGDWLAECPVTGRSWAVTAKAVIGSTEITEAQAKKQYFDIETDTIKGVVCGTCCGWKCGKEALSVKFKLDIDQDRVPADEITRLQDELRKFFARHGAISILPYIHPTLDKTTYKGNKGLELEFIATKEIKEECIPG